MIIEIHYRGEVIGEVELSQQINIKELRLSARLQSKMNEKVEYVAPCLDVTEEEMPKKKLVRDRPQFIFPEREVKPFVRPKAEYSNAAFLSL